MIRPLHCPPPVSFPSDVGSRLTPSPPCNIFLSYSFPSGLISRSLASRGSICFCTATSSSSVSVASLSGFDGSEAVDGGDGPCSIDLEPIVGEGEFDRVMEEARRGDQLVVVLWKASWCRKCIYLKPKLEKLAVTYYPRIKFYSIDVNSVPQRLVNWAGVLKMPTIQLWKDCKKQEEVIGGHKTWLVINDVQQMIENCSIWCILCEVLELPLFQRRWRPGWTFRSSHGIMWIFVGTWHFKGKIRDEQYIFLDLHVWIAHQSYVDMLVLLHFLLQKTLKIQVSQN